MKSAACFLRPSTSTTPGASTLFGTQYIPASLVMELHQLLMAGQYDPAAIDKLTGEPRFALKASMWRETDPSKGYVLSGRLESPAETAAYEASRASSGVTAPAGAPWGAPAPPQGPPPGYAPPGYAPPQGPPPGYAPPGYAPPQGAPPQGPPLQGVPPQGAPVYRPAVAPPPPAPPAPPAWGRPGAQPGGWGA